MEERKERTQFNLSPEDNRRIDELAEANAGNNRSLLIRKLVTMAWGNPKLFGLHPPKGHQASSEDDLGG